MKNYYKKSRIIIGILAVFDRSSGSVNAAVITVFLYIGTTVMVIVHYIQTLIVLVCRARAKEKIMVDKKYHKDYISKNIFRKEAIICFYL